ncbi:MAG: hypothetical protein FJ290_09175 [Planctomycetes bacterium]|nr:hypothetical protein [Planctomycetota bacterium]
MAKRGCGASGLLAVMAATLVAAGAASAGPVTDPSVVGSDLLANKAPAAGQGPGLPTYHVRYAFVPNDPYFHRDTPAAGWPGQWHLINEHVAGLDAGLQGAWNRDLTGAGVIIGMVDDCLQTTHPDLAPNYIPAHSWDFGQGDANPDPVYSNDRHGVSTAGVAAARGGNALGVTGAAPYAGLAGLRIDFPNQTDAMFVNATLYHSSGGDTSIGVKNHSYGIPAPYIPSTNQVNALVTSATAGTIHCLAAGNDRGTSGQDANKKDLQNSPEAIAVAALGSDGMYAWYSNFGANVFVTAPSSGVSYGITTTDRTGTLGYNTDSGDTFPDVDYTSVFGGTSASSPIVAGIMALGKQVRPDMDVRLAKHLLTSTSKIVHPTDASVESDGGWKTNAAGYQFNQNYGFGLVDADAFTLAAADPLLALSPLSTESTGRFSVGLGIPDASPTGITQTFQIDSSVPLEEMLVYLNITHTYRGDLEAYLTSPSGTTGRLMIRSGSDGADNIDWWFTSNTFWGEDPQGTWSLNVRDVFAIDTGTWNSFEALARMGYTYQRSQGEIPEPCTLSLVGLGLLAFLRRRARR